MKNGRCGRPFFLKNNKTNASFFRDNFVFFRGGIRCLGVGIRVRVSVLSAVFLQFSKIPFLVTLEPHAGHNTPCSPMCVLDP